ncbi:Aste57867_14476 [Aphanomyces stellatus]|uniref:Aste57867_14476 protein n=1 Tax=Aphanomyces stellatus TaxID=120398 RepID=A0A485L383_9STRA|nr:hypothetical protein As57867_014422 [Aphanomyces stellatus]VFT91298.1 Aste57867_14476 [Aphanomyces stellatus]
MDFDTPSAPTVAATALTLALGLFLWSSMHRAASSSIPTVPSWLPFLGSSLEFSGDCVGFLRKCQARFGDVFNVYLGGKTMTFFVSPKHYGALLKHKALSSKPVFANISQQALGESEAFATFMYRSPPSDATINYHKLLLPHLHHSGAVAALVDQTFRQQRRVLAHYRGVPRVSLLEFVNHCIFESGTRVLMGDSLVDKSPTLMNDFAAFDKSFPLLVAGVPALFLRAAVGARQRLVDALHAYTGHDAATIIQKRLEALKLFDHGDATDPAKESMALLWAASANSIPTTFWTLFHLLDNPAAWDAVRDEVQLHLPSQGVETWTSEQLGQCVLLASAVDEALRLSASSIAMRVATEDIDLNIDNSTVQLAKGSHVMIFPNLAHADETIFPSPHTFQFDRFVHATAAQKEAFKPFGMGVSMCPGRNFAKNQVKMFVALLMLETKQVSLVPGYIKPKLDTGRLGLGILPPTDASIEIELEM